MAATVKIVWNAVGVKQLLKSDDVQADLDDRGAAIADACNAQSSWGGYESGPAEPEGATAETIVWSIGENDDETRQQRLAHNLDAGS